MDTRSMACLNQRMLAIVAHAVESPVFGKAAALAEPSECASPIASTTMEKGKTLILRNYFAFWRSIGDCLPCQLQQRMDIPK